MTTRITSIGQLMTEKLETIALANSAQQAAKKMRDKNVSSLVVVDNNDKPIGIVTERDLVRKVCVHDTSINSIILLKDIMSSPLVSTDALSPVGVAADIMIQNRVRHLLVVENDDINRPLGIITPTDFVGYLKEDLNINDVNARILQSMQESKYDNLSEELEREGKLPTNPPKGGEEHENEQPRQGL